MDGCTDNTPLLSKKNKSQSKCYCSGFSFRAVVVQSCKVSMKSNVIDADGLFPEELHKLVMLTDYDLIIGHVIMDSKLQRSFKRLYSERLMSFQSFVLAFTRH